MWVFLCVVAVCTLLTPAQGSGMAEIYLCKGSLKQTITDIIEQLSLKSLLQSSIGRGEQKGSRSLRSVLPVDSKVPSLATTTGVKINEAKVLNLDLNMKNSFLNLNVYSLISIAISVSTTDIFKGSQLPLTNSASEPTKLTAEISHHIPLEVSIAKHNKLKISLDEQNCKLLKVNIVLESDMLNGTLAAVKDLADNVTETLGDTVGGILSDAVCKSVLPTVLNLFNQKLNLLGGTFPLGSLRQTLTYAINAVTGFVGNCLVIDVNVTSDGQLLDVQTAPSSGKNPIHYRDGTLLRKELLDKIIAIQKPKDRLNSKLNRNGPMKVSLKRIFQFEPDSDFLDDVILIIEVTENPETILEENTTPKLKTSTHVKAIGSETSAPIFDVTLDAVANTKITIEDQSMKFTAELERLDNIVQKSNTTFEDSALKSILTIAANKLIESINAPRYLQVNSLLYKFPWMNGWMDYFGKKCRGMNYTNFADDMQIYFPLSGNYTLQLSSPVPVTGMDIKNTTMQMKQDAITFFSVDNKK